MLDLRRIRSEPDVVREALARRGEPEVLDALGQVIELDVRRRELLPELEELRKRRNEASDAIGAAKRAGEDASAAIAAMQEVGGREKALSIELAEVEAALEGALIVLPNLPAEGAPPEDTVLREVGEAGRTGRDHLELAGPLIDMEAGARVAGSRFAYLLRDLVPLELALVRFDLELLGEEGFQPVLPPALVREEAMFGTGFL